MNTQRNVARRLEEEIANARAPPSGGQVPPLEEGEDGEHVLVNPPPLTNENMRTTLLHMAQAITTLSKATTTQAKL